MEQVQIFLDVVPPMAEEQEVTPTELTQDLVFLTMTAVKAEHRHRAVMLPGINTLGRHIVLGHKMVQLGLVVMEAAKEVVVVVVAGTAAAVEIELLVAADLVMQTRLLRLIYCTPLLIHVQTVL